MPFSIPADELLRTFGLSGVTSFPQPAAGHLHGRIHRWPRPVLPADMTPVTRKIKIGSTQKRLGRDRRPCLGGSS